MDLFGLGDQVIPLENLGKNSLGSASGAAGFSWDSGDLLLLQVFPRDLLELQVFFPSEFLGDILVLQVFPGEFSRDLLEHQILLDQLVATTTQL